MSDAASTRRLAYIVPAVLFALVAAFLFGGLDPNRNPAEVPSALIDKPAPDFDLPPLYDGQPGLTGADLKGGPVLVNFFASWCVPCRAEHPLLMRLSRDEGATVHGIAYKNEVKDARGFLDELGNPFAKVGVDRDGRTAIDFGVYGVPETYVIDKEGRIRYRRAGPLDRRVLEEEVLPLLMRLRQ